MPGCFSLRKSKAKKEHQTSQKRDEPPPRQRRVEFADLEDDNPGQRVGVERTLTIPQRQDATKANKEPQPSQKGDEPPPRQRDVDLTDLEHKTHQRVAVDLKIPQRQDAYCGLQISGKVPHSVVAVVDVLDEKGRSPSDSGYSNEIIDVGDLILSVDGAVAQYIPSSVLFKVLQGKLGSVLTLELLRKEGTKYTVNLQRHKYHEFDTEIEADLGSVMTIGTTAEKELLITAARDDAVGYCGLKISTVPPHDIVSVEDVVDSLGRRPEHRDYENMQILPGDRVSKISGTSVLHATQVQIRSLLHGPLNSVVEIELSRMRGGQEFTFLVKLGRHRRHEFATAPSSESEHSYCGIVVTDECPHRIVNCGLKMLERRECEGGGRGRERVRMCLCGCVVFVSACVFTSSHLAVLFLFHS